MKVWVTRDEPPNGPLGRALRARGLEPVHEPVIERVAISDAREAIEALGPDDWLVLTSPFAVQCVAEAPARAPRVAVVGEASRRAAEKRGFRVELVSREPGRDALFEELFSKARGRTVCYPRSSLAQPPAAPEDVMLVSPVLYKTRLRAFDSDAVREAAVVAVASPSAAQAAVASGKPIASIGRSTTAALRSLGVEPVVEAATPSMDALARAIHEYLRRTPGDLSAGSKS